jgi:hypothetical protein
MGDPPKKRIVNILSPFIIAMIEKHYLSRDFQDFDAFFPVLLQGIGEKMK